MKRRLVSMFAAVALCLTLLPTAALADEPLPTEGDLEITDTVVETTWTDGSGGTIKYEPAADDPSPAKLTLTGITFGHNIVFSINHAVEVAVSGTCSVNAIFNSDSDLELTGDGALTGGITAGKFDKSTFTGTLNSLISLPNTSAVCVYGDVTIPSSSTQVINSGGKLFVDENAALTIESGGSLSIYNNVNLENVKGTIKNNGTVTIEGEFTSEEAAVGFIKALKLTGSDGKVTATVNGTGKEFPNDGETILDLRDVTTEVGDLTADGYRWVPETDGYVPTSGTLTLADGFSAKKIIFPDVPVEIVTNGDCTIGTLTTPKLESYASPDIYLTFSGSGTLTLRDTLNFSAGFNSIITVAKGAHILAEKGMIVGGSGSVGGTVEVNGILEAGEYPSGDNIAIQAGKVTVGTEGKLYVGTLDEHGEPRQVGGGIRLGGVMVPDPDDPLLTIFTLADAFTIADGGAFSVNCTDFIIRAYGRNDLFEIGDNHDQALASLTTNYLPPDCEVKVKEADGKIGLFQKGTDEDYKGQIVVHNHGWSRWNSSTGTYEPVWMNDATNHWQQCRNADPCSTTHFNEAPHDFGSDNICDTCGYDRQPGGSNPQPGGPNPPVHTHRWDTEWTSDDTQHWHRCLNGCTRRGDAADHVYDDECDPDCNVCGYTREVPHRHVWAEDWSRDEAHHWHECTAEGCDIVDDSQKDGYADHVYDDEWDPDCNVCGYTREVPHRHVWAEEWSHDETHHWHECTAEDCDLTDDSQKDGYEEHVYSSRWDATCNVCGCQRKVSSPSGGSGILQYYDVKVEPSDHGNVRADRSQAAEGTTVTLILAPDGGYKLDSLTVTVGGVGEQTVSVHRDGRYTFAMPGGSVTVKAIFAPLTTEDEPEPVSVKEEDGPSQAFSDLDSGAWYYEAVSYMLERGLMSGYGDGQFKPDAPLTRAQFVQILYNKAGRPAAAGVGTDFADVASDAWCAPAVAWAAEQGIVGGYSGGRFDPDGRITREQLAVMLWRYEGSPAPDSRELRFTDADQAGAYAREALCWAVENGILNGCSGGRLDSKGLATRAQTAQMLYSVIKDWEGKA